MADFAKPVPTDLYADILTGLIDTHATLAKMFDGTTDSNVPTGAIKYNGTNKRFEKYDGAAWNAVQVGNLADGSVTAAALAADAADDTKVRLRANNWLRSRNFAGSGDLNVLKTDGSDNTVVNAPAARTVGLAVNGTVRWFANDASPNPEFYPGAHDSLNIGQSGARVANAYIRYLQNLERIEANGAHLLVRTNTAHEIQFYLNGTQRLNISNVGDLYPQSDGGTSLGLTGFQFLKVYAGTFTAKNGAPAQLIAPSGQPANLGAGGVALWSLAASGLLTPVGAYDIGSAGAPLNAVVTNSVKSGTSSDLNLIPPASRALGLGANNGLFWALLTTGVLGPLSDGNLDIALTATRVRDAYIGSVQLGPSGSSAYITGNAGRIRLGTTIAGSAGSIVEYALVERPDGTQRKIALYAV